MGDVQGAVFLMLVVELDGILVSRHVAKTTLFFSCEALFFGFGFLVVNRLFGEWSVFMYVSLIFVGVISEGYDNIFLPLHNLLVV